MNVRLDGPVPAPTASAEDVWRWLAACLTCGEEHFLRPETCKCGRQCRCAPSGYQQTWAHPGDGHVYRTRLAAGEVAALKASWQQEGTP